jgi:thiol-disulfide isomerase/thioredoxin
MRVWSRLFLASVSFSIHLTVAAVDFERCSALPPEERVRCVETQLDTAELEPEHLRDLDPLVASEPASVLEITVAIEGRLQGTPVFRAALLDLQAEALMALGKFEEAALRAREALDTSSGVRSLDWRSATGAPVWTAAVDDPGERRVKLARALAAIDAREQARALTEAALRSGAGDDARQLWADLSGGEVPGLDAEPAPLLAGPWFPRLPPVSVTLTDGGSVALADLRGNVLILDFWASWCEPCLAELPELGRLYESEKQRGLEVIIVNMGESQSHAERFARDLGLQMPGGG